MAVLASAACLVAMTGCGTSEDTGGDSVAGGQDPVVLTYATFVSPTSTLDVGMQAWQEEVTERTDGAVTFENYHSASLLGATDVLSGLQGGVADIGLIIPSYYPQQLPVNSWAMGMGAAVAGTPERAVGTGSIAATDFLMGTGPAREEYESLGLSPLAITSSPPYHMLCSKHVTGADSTQGMSARTSSELWARVISEMGMTSVSVPYTELYESVQRGVVDCGLTAMTGFEESSLHEVAKHYVPVPLPQQQASTFVWNKDTWDSLDPETQQIMHEATATLFEATAESYMDTTDSAASSLFGSEGVELDDSGELVQTVQQANDEVLSSMPGQAPDAVENPEQVVGDYLATLEHWNGVMTELEFQKRPAEISDFLSVYDGLADRDFAALADRFAAEVIDSTGPAA